MLKVFKFFVFVNKIFLVFNDINIWFRCGWCRHTLWNFLKLRTMFTQCRSFPVNQVAKVKFASLYFFQNFFPVDFNKSVEIGCCHIRTKSSWWKFILNNIDFFKCWIKQPPKYFNIFCVFMLILPAQLVSAKVDRRCLQST